MGTDKLYKLNGVLWSIDGATIHGPIVKARCPNDRCELNINEYSNVISCPKCELKLHLHKSYVSIKSDALKIIQSGYWKDAEVINIDGEMIKVGKEVTKDPDYWVESSISKNIKGGKQLMVLVGSKKESDKVQLFLDIENEKLSFDQNNKHPKTIFAKVTAEFKDSTSIIEPKNDSKKKSK